MRTATLVLLKTLALAVCLMFVFQGKPPAKGQSVQDHEIAELNQHLTHTDGIVDSDGKRLRDIELQMAEMQGEERVAFLIVGALSGGSLILQIKIKRKDA